MADGALYANKSVTFALRVSSPDSPSRLFSHSLIACLLDSSLSVNHSSLWLHSAMLILTLFHMYKCKICAQLKKFSNSVGKQTCPGPRRSLFSRTNSHFDCEIRLLCADHVFGIVGFLGVSVYLVLRSSRMMPSET